ncbi:response regulator [Desulfonema ishimotonii]|uniref:Response regulator n=1 Tax=Desulfonema ishimotonii TaxID=45657 RepID=A0A401FSV0_9BACT|nr:response regulator [Desulfonema ishimotonii]GBC60035.1 response regulator [Desulfonema ishimotonii]
MFITLLIVDEDSPFRRNLFQRLRREKYDILLTGEKDEAGQMVRRKNIDVILINLDGMGREGLAILKTVKGISPSTEAIILNSSKQIALSIKGMKLGAFDDFLVPFDIESLISRIRDAYRRRTDTASGKKIKQPDTDRLK